MSLTDTAREWLQISLRHRLDDARKAERRARGAYTKGPLAVACERLADTYAEVVGVYVRALNGLVRPEDLSAALSIPTTVYQAAPRTATSNNCALANMHPESECQVCRGLCPDREP